MTTPNTVDALMALVSEYAGSIAHLCVLEDYDPDNCLPVERKNAASLRVAIEASARALAAMPAPTEDTTYYVSGPYATGSHAGFHAVAELATGRIVHFFKPDQSAQQAGGVR